MIEVLLSTMNQNNLSFLDEINANTNILVINQTDKEDYLEIQKNNKTVRMISCSDRGISKSRNLAIKNSIGDICVLCDDDVRYVDEFEAIVKEAFNNLPNADLIVFNISQMNSRYSTEKQITKVHKVPIYKSYGSVRIAFRKESILENNIWFNEKFGTGSGMYSMAEDSLFLREARRKRLKIYAYPKKIANVDFSTSTWFKGYDKKYFYDIGAFLSAAYPVLKYILIFYYPFRMKNMTDLTSYEIICLIQRGFYGYKKKISYDEMECELNKYDVEKK
ncbi:hypothetical protein B5E87_02795 [Massilimicrobiota sp. An142]|uniref:glycosyltransferase family 2 protein n=1 Tax=Massilimicrobiota sp. An142 TaxID=1965564 RepID=UPI000B36EF3F|nr:glycosyltransferase family A protein [Massilimicrobiota sp. An142]OUQ14427.1 hypothetical protein B5E87_02795 [Massilimicrobiota sp. An142]